MEGIRYATVRMQAREFKRNDRPALGTIALHWGRSPCTGDDRPAWGRSPCTGDDRPAWGRSPCTGDDRPALGTIALHGDDRPALGTIALHWGRSPCTGDDRPALGTIALHWGRSPCTGDDRPALGTIALHWGRSPCMGTIALHGDEEKSSMQSQSGIVDVVDLLSGPIWHIIFRHLLLGSSSGAPQEGGAGSASGASLLSRLKKNLQSLGNSSGASQEGAGSTSPGATGSGLLSRLKKKLQNWGNSSGASQEGGAGDACFGSCWPLLRCAMVCKRLLHHVASFPEFEPMKLTINSEDPALTRLSGTLSVFLTHAPHTPLNVVLSSPQDLHCLGRLLGPSARSLTTLSLEHKEMIPWRQLLLHSEFLGEFEQLQKLVLGSRGIWKLGSLNPAMFQALRSLSIHDFECEKNALPFLSSVAPQLHEFALASSSFGSASATLTLDFKLTAARSITVCLEQQALHLRFALPASLKSFSATAASLNVDCTCNSRLSLDSLSLIGRSQLLVSSLPLAAAKSHSAYSGDACIEVRLASGGHACGVEPPSLRFHRCREVWGD
ncbi:unnamed protein product [Closterium sp. NIES-65]|nr:unnamed protein product [Closterium sp. NIES-65]